LFSGYIGLTNDFISRLSMLVAHCLINKLAAFLYQESSILFAGRQVHPLFSQWKVGKSNPKNYDPESNCGMTIAKDKHFKFGSIDVLEDIKMIVTTPEKWDVITRKGSDMPLSMLVKLLIIDEVDLLNVEVVLELLRLSSLWLSFSEAVKFLS
ncbi:hypothetical protein Dimus_007961, partial [Dionaea muscipula]